MKGWLSALFLGALAGLSCLEASANGAKPGQVTVDPRRLDQEVARFSQKAAKEGRGVAVYFHAEWCGPCAEVQAVLDRMQRDDQLSHWYVLKVDVDGLPTGPALGLAVETIPLLAKLDRRGKVQAVLGGDNFGPDPTPDSARAVLAAFLP